MITEAPLEPAHLHTFPALSAALDAARMRFDEDDDFEVINSPEVWAAFLLLCDECIGADAFIICTSEEAAIVFDVMKDVDFCPLSSQHLALGICLFAVIHLRSGV